MRLILSARTLIIGIVVFGIASCALAFPTFTDQTSAAGISVLASGQGVAWGDYDNDGDEDLVIGRNASSPVLYKNNGNGTFTEVSVSAISGAQSGNCVVWGDVDNDGDLDLFVGAYGQSGQNYLFRNDGSDNFTDISVSSGITASDESFTAAFADYDGDGDLDLYAGGYAFDNVLLINNGSGVFTALSPFAGQGAGEARGCVWFDYDSDGDLDLYLSVQGSDCMMLRNDAGTLVDATGGAPLNNSGGNGRAACVADFDNDGDSDLYIANASATNKLLRNDGGSFTDLTPHTLAVSMNTIGLALADFNHDGNVDVYLHNGGQADKMYQNDGSWNFSDVTVAPLDDAGTGRGSAVADYDNDGDVDLVINNNDSTGATLLRNEQNDTKWLKVKAVGANGKNLFGIGCIVKVYVAGTSTLVGMRQIGANVSYDSMDSLIAHFGLPSASQKYDVKATFPSGALRELANVDPGQMVTVDESGAAIPTPTPPPALVGSAQWCLYE